MTESKKDLVELLAGIRAVTRKSLDQLKEEWGTDNDTTIETKVQFNRTQVALEMIIQNME